MQLQQYTKYIIFANYYHIYTVVTQQLHYPILRTRIEKHQTATSFGLFTYSCDYM